MQSIFKNDQNFIFYLPSSKHTCQLTNQVHEIAASLDYNSILLMWDVIQKVCGWWVWRWKMSCCGD